MKGKEIFCMRGETGGLRVRRKSGLLVDMTGLDVPSSQNKAGNHRTKETGVFKNRGKKDPQEVKMEREGGSGTVAFSKTQPVAHDCCKAKESSKSGKGRRRVEEKRRVIQKRGDARRCLWQNKKGQCHTRFERPPCRYKTQGIGKGEARRRPQCLEKSSRIVGGG